MRHPIREDIRVGVPITLEPGPARIFLPIHQQVFLGPGFTTRLAKLGGQRSIFAPTIGFAGLLWPSLCSLGRGSYSVPMVPGSEGSAGSGVSRSSLSLLPRPRVS